MSYAYLYLSRSLSGTVHSLDIPATKAWDLTSAPYVFSLHAASAWFAASPSDTTRYRQAKLGSATQSRASAAAEGTRPEAGVGTNSQGVEGTITTGPRHLASVAR